MMIHSGAFTGKITNNIGLIKIFHCNNLELQSSWSYAAVWNPYNTQKEEGVSKWRTL